MKLYKRDYTRLTAQEIAEWEEYKGNEKNGKSGMDRWRMHPKYRKYPRAVRHYLSLFPNNFLDPIQLMENDALPSLVTDFETFLNDKPVIEIDILKHINHHENRDIVFMLGSLFRTDYNFGNHGLYIFPEFELGTNYNVDYLIVGKNSGGYHFLFVELERPYGRITVKSGDFGQVINKGVQQVKDWQKWLPSNFPALKEEFKKKLNPNESLPSEFTEYDPTRMYYLVMAGRREDFNEKTRWEQRSLKEDSKINVLHYDNLIDNSNRIIGNDNY